MTATRIEIVPAAAKRIDSTADAQTARFLRPGRIRLAALPPLSLYVHFPWCVRKCPYCDFNSHEAGTSGPTADDERAYLDALRRDLELALPSIWGRRVHTVFIGGGTPSLLSPGGLDRLLSDLRALLPIDADAEVTLEANPGTAEAARFASYRTSGVNRLSIGVQSFDDRALRALGRIHGRDEAIRAIELAQRHFDRFNIDLMYGLPGQSLEQALDDVRRALGFGGSHLSIYQLTLEPNTTFAKYPPALPDEDTIASMQSAIEEANAAAGLHPYEVSAYARPGFEARHNLNYWSFGDYLGIGAGAHGKLSFPERIVRQARFRQPASYVQACRRDAPIADEHEVSTEDLPFEFLLNTLRLVDGVPTTTFEQRTGIPVARIGAILGRAVDRGLLDPDPTRLRATPLGRRFLNDLQAMFLVS